ncbi:ribulose-phosphate 3-epimerase [Acidisoma sp. 7E03]
MPAPNWMDLLPRHRLLAEFSFWSADLGHLAEDVSRTDAFADLYHLDVADGHFAPALLFFPDLVARLRRLTGRPFHVHLMAADAVLLSQIDQFAEAGADLISIHVENQSVLPAALDRIRQHGLKTGLVLKLATPVNAIEPLLGAVDFVTLLGTAIGVKGQGLSPEACPRLATLRWMIAAAGRTDSVILAADGGIREGTVPDLAAAGAQTVVMGSLAFGAPDLSARMRWLHGLPLAA